MSQAERDRLVCLKKASKKLITRAAAAAELKVSERQVYRLLAALKVKGDSAVVHGLRGRTSNRKISATREQEAVKILAKDVYRGFGPTLASEYLASKHGIIASKETVRQWMVRAGLRRVRRERIEQVHVWRERRHRYGELVQWDTSEHDWLEGRGEKIYLIKMIDDASSRLFARFVRHDSTEENMAVLQEYLQRFGRPLEFYTDKASLFSVNPRLHYNKHLSGDTPKTQIGRALEELGVGWIAAHSPQAKGRVERSFETAQDRLVKGLRVARVTTLEEANQYLETEYLPQWKEKFTVAPAAADDAHRPLGKDQDLTAILCHVEQRTVTSDYTIRFHSAIYQIMADQVRPRLRQARVRVEQRRSGMIAVCWEGKYLRVSVCDPAPKPKTIARKSVSVKSGAGKAHNAGGKSQWMKGYYENPSPKLGKAIAIANATS
jgi:transposase-like protein